MYDSLQGDIRCPYCNEDVSYDKYDELFEELYDDGDYTKTKCECCEKLFKIFVEIESMKSFTCSETKQPPDIPEVKGQMFFNLKSDKSDEDWTKISEISSNRQMKDNPF